MGQSRIVLSPSTSSNGPESCSTSTPALALAPPTPSLRVTPSPSPASGLHDTDLAEALDYAQNNISCGSLASSPGCASVAYWCPENKNFPSRPVPSYKRLLCLDDSTNRIGRVTDHMSFLSILFSFSLALPLTRCCSELNNLLF
jgi:hypothetical protein